MKLENENKISKDLKVTYKASRIPLAYNDFAFTIRFESDNNVLEFSNKEGKLFCGICACSLFQYHSIDRFDVMEKLESVEQIESKGIIENVDYIDYDDLKELGIDFEPTNFHVYIHLICLQFIIKNDETRKELKEKIKTFNKECF